MQSMCGTPAGEFTESRNLAVRRSRGEAAHADELLENDDMAGCETWHRILNAIERLQAKAPADGEGVH
jgi:hypothetical protein